MALVCCCEVTLVGWGAARTGRVPGRTADSDVIRPEFGSMVMFETERLGFAALTVPSIGLPGAATTDTWGAMRVGLGPEAETIEPTR